MGGAIKAEESKSYRHPCETCGAVVGAPCVAMRTRGGRNRGDALPFVHEPRKMLNRFSSGIHGMPLRAKAAMDSLAIDQALARGMRVYEIVRDLGVTEDDVYCRMDALDVERAG